MNLWIRNSSPNKGLVIHAPKSGVKAYPDAPFAVIHPENYLDFVMPASEK
jgi:hypothetical protein